MNSSEALAILNAWKSNQLGIFVLWVASANGVPAVAFDFEGWIRDVDEDAIAIVGAPSSRIEGVDKLHARFLLKDSTPSDPDPRRVRFTFLSGAVLDLLLS